MCWDLGCGVWLASAWYLVLGPGCWLATGTEHFDQGIGSSARTGSAMGVGCCNQKRSSVGETPPPGVEPGSSIRFQAPGAHYLAL